MKNEWEARIESLMNKHERQVEGIREATKEQFGFLERFDEIQKREIRPVMRRIGNQLKRRGYDFRISTKGRPVREIEMEIFTVVEDTKVTKTWIKFLAKDYDRMVLMRGVGAVRGTLDLEEFRLSRINRDLIGRYIYTVLAKAFG